MVLAAGIVLIHRVSPRSLIGFHGLTHTAITYSVLDGDLPPDNPLAAGLPLPYYWVYHVMLAGVVHVTGFPPVVAAETINLLVAVCLTLVLIGLGRWLVGRPSGALLGLAIALFGVNPLGPLLLLYRVLTGGIGLSIDAFARSPAHPMLRAMYLDAGVRWGCGYFFLLQPSSRCVGFLAGLVAAGLVLTSVTRPAPWRLAMIAISVGLACAMNPIVGTGTAMGLCVALTIVARPWQCRITRPIPGWIPLCVALLVGVVIALPTYHQLLDGHSVGFPVERSVAALGVKGVEVILFGMLPIGLTVWAWHRGRLRRPQLRILAACGWFLLGLCWISHVPAGREHSFFNLAVLMLAIPAAAACVRPRRACALSGRRAWTRAGWLAVAGIVPVSLITMMSFVYRPPLVLQRDGVFLRDGRDADRSSVYAWITAHTPRGTLILTDVRDGRRTAFYAPESEVPAMTGRKLFIDVPGMYMPVDPEVEARRQVIDALYTGRPLTPAQRRTLRAPVRQLVALCSAPDDERGLLSSGWKPLFRAGSHAVYAVPPECPPTDPCPPNGVVARGEENRWRSSR